MRITSKGQVTIPADIREKAWFLPHTEVDVILEGETVRLVRASQTKGESRGEEIVRRLRSAKTNRTTTEQIMALTRGENGSPSWSTAT